MSTITTRETGATSKDAPLTNAELDANFINLNTDKHEDGVSPTYAGVTVDLLDFTQGAAPTRAEGRLFYDNTRKCLSLFIDEVDFTWQLGRELPMRVYNNTAGTLLNGRAARVAGVGTGGGSYSVPYIDYASSSFIEGVALNTIGIITHDIEPGSFGEVTIVGWVNDVNTSAPLVAGEVAWLAASSPPDGSMTAVVPSSPDYRLEMGGCLVSDPTNGVLWSYYLPRGNVDDVFKIFNGAILEHHSVAVTSDGVTVTMTLDNSGDYLSLFFNGVFYSLPIPSSVSLTPGTDTTPVENFVYIPEATKVLTVSTTGWPSGVQYVAVANIICQSATSVQADGPYKVHAWTDHLSSGEDQGHLSEINKWIRYQNATWLSGAEVTISGTGTGTVGVSCTSGQVLQLHSHAFPTFLDPAEIWVQNNFTTPYTKVTNLVNITADSLGNTLVNRSFALVLWGVVSEDGTDCKIMCNLPSGSYSASKPGEAAADILKYSDYGIPAEYKGTGFLLRRVVCSFNPAGTLLTIYDYTADDLRGTVPGTVAGSSVTGGGALPPSGAQYEHLEKQSAIDGDAIWSSTLTNKKVKAASEVEKTDHAVTGVGQTITLNYTDGNSQTITCDTNDAFTISTSNWPTTEAGSMVITIISNNVSGVGTPTWTDDDGNQFNSAPDLSGITADATGKGKYVMRSDNSLYSWHSVAEV